MREIKNVCPSIRWEITAFVLYLSIVSASAQQKIPGGIKVSINKTNISLKEVFKQIEQQTGTRFFYADKVLNGAEKLSVHFSNLPLQDALDQLLKERKLNWNYNAQLKTVEVIADQPASGSTNTTSIVPGSNTGITVSGKVTNTTGVALPGTYVLLKGTNKGVITTENGEFSMTNVPANGTLVFSFAGYEREEVGVNGRADLSVTLRTKVAELSDITISVNTGYQVFSKERSVGSYTKVDSSLFHREISTDLISRLDGIAGSVLFDKRSGNSKPQIRGISSLTGSVQSPLVILDNFPFDGDINNINPNDVVDITILKDGAAASIWGARAGNGVIVITTKKGKYSQPLSISLNSNLTIQEKPNLFYFPQMNSSDFIDVEKLLFGNGFYDADLANTSTRPVISPVVEILSKVRNATITQEQADAQINNFRSNDIRNDYKRYVFRKSVSQQHYINLRGGSNSASYLFSVGYDKNISSINGPGKYERITLNSNNKIKLLKNVELEAGVNFVNSLAKADGLNYPLAPGGTKSQIFPYAKLADEQGNALAVVKYYRMGFIDTAGGGKLLDWHYRPLEEMNLIDNASKIKYYLFNLGLNTRITDWLNASIKYQYSDQSGNKSNNQGKGMFDTRDLINTFTRINGTNIANVVPIGGILDLSNSETIKQNIRGQLNFNRSWGNRHGLIALLAGEVNDTRTKSNSNRIYGYNDRILTYATNIDYLNVYSTYLNDFAYVPSGLSISDLTNRFVSFLGNVSYTFNDRYAVYVSARRDGANLYGVNTNNKWKPLWSVGGNWNISKEGFYSLKWMPDLRLRASYGYAGNTNNSIAAVTTINYGGAYPFTNLNYASLNNPPNPDYRWEEVRTLNVGVDFSIVKNALSGSIEWYQKKSNNIVTAVPVDPTLGVTSSTININAANLKGSGIDVNLNSRNLKGKLQWNTSVNISYNKTIVTKYYRNVITGAPQGNGINPTQGNIAWGLYSYRWTGLDPANGDPNGYFKGQESKDYLSIMNDSIQNQVLHGSSLPLYFGNITNAFSWKGFSLSANITFRFDYYFRKPSINYSALYNNWVGHSDYSQRWLKPGDEKITHVPSISYPANPNRDAFYAGSEINVARGDNIRLKDIRLSYSWDRLTKGWLIQSIQLFIYANNLNWMLWKSDKSGMDPDYGSAYLPPIKSLAAGVSVNF